jgi:hypothetical protein
MDNFRKAAVIAWFFIATVALVGCSKDEQAQQPAAVEKVAGPTSIMVDLTKYVGQHPTEILNEPLIATNLKRILGNSYTKFVDQLNVGGGLENIGDYYFGEGCAPHNCSIDESAFVVNKKDLSVYAVLLTDGDKLAVFGASTAQNLPASLGEWYQAKGGKEEIAKSEVTAKIQKTDVGSAVSDSKYTRTKEDIALQCHYKDPRSENNWIYLIDSDSNEVNKIFKIDNNKIDVTHNIDRKRTTGSEIVFDVTSFNKLLVKQLNPGNIDPSDYEKFIVDRSSLDMENEVLSKILSSYPERYKFICELMNSEMYVRLIDDIKARRAATKAKEASNKI